MRKTVEVVDNFYRDPMTYRHRALKGAGLVKGAEKTSIHRNPSSSDSPNDDEATNNISRILKLNPSASRVTVCGYFNLRNEGACKPLAKQLERFDWVGLVCLSLLDRSSSSIWFYHREQSPPRTLNAEATPDGSEHEAGRASIYFPMRFNRMLLFQASAFDFGLDESFKSGIHVQVLAVSE